MEEFDGYDKILLERILYDGEPYPAIYEFPQPKTFKFKFTPDPAETFSEDPDKLEKLLLGQQTSIKVEESFDPLDLIHIKELNEMSSTPKQIKNYLNDKRKYQASKLPTVHIACLKDLSQHLSYPTVLRVTDSFIIIGNNYGILSIFSHSISEIRTLQSPKSFGAVSAIDLSADEVYLISGYAGGQLILWDFKSGSSIRANNSYHTSPITAFKFYKGNLSAISADSSGKIMLVEYAKSFLSTSISAIDVLNGELGCISDIQILTSETTGHNLDNCSIAAFAGYKAVILYNLSPELGCFYNFSRPQSVGEGYLPALTWKYVKFTSGRFYSLTISWGSSLVIYNVRFNISEGVELVRTIDLNGAVYSVLWVSDEVFVASSRIKDYIVKAEEGKVIYETSRSFEVVGRVGNKEISSFICTGSEKLNRTVFLLGLKEAYTVNLLTWSECIDDLSNKGEWLEVLSFGLDLYTNNYPSQYGCPDSIEELRNILEQLITIYVKVGTIAWVHKICNTIEFCVEINALDILFNMLLDFFVDHGSKENMEYFVDNLEPYILSGKIKQIPSFVMGRLMAFYLRQDKALTIEKILLNLDPKTIDTDQVMPIIKEYKLLSAGIVVCAQISEFLAPFVMIFSAFVAEKEIFDKKYLFYKLMWYLRMCFRGEIFLGGKIEKDLWIHSVKNIVDWCISEKCFEILIKHDVVCVLKTLWEGFEFNCIETHEELLQNLSDASKPSSYSFLHFSCFAAKAVETFSIKIQYELAIDISVFLLKVNKDIENIPVGGRDIDAYINNFTYGEQNRLAFTHFTIPELGKTVLKLLKTLARPQENDISLLLGISKSTSHTQVQVYLQDLQQDFTKSLYTLLYSREPADRQEIFDWLESKFKESEQAALKKEVIEVLSSLVEIDSDKTAHLVRDWYQNSHSFIIKKLDNAPELQLKYLGELLKDQFDKDLLLRYVKLLCQHNQTKLLKFLKTCDLEYIEECLKICNDFKASEAEAFLNEKLGAVKEALDLILEIIFTTKDQLISRMIKREPVLAKDISELGRRIEKYGKVCVRNSTALDTCELEEFWLRIFKESLDCYMEFKDFYYLYPQLEPVMHNSISYILTHMLEHVDLANIITCISQEYGEFPFKHMRSNIIDVLERHSHQKKIKMQALRLLKADTAVSVSQLYSSRLEGHASDFFLCRSCGKKVGNLSGSIYIFACGHVFHKRCQEIPACLICNDAQINRQ